MKYIVIVLVLALGASAVSAASLFLDTQAAEALQGISPDAGVSMPWLMVSGLGMMVTIAWRCYAAEGSL